MTLHSCRLSLAALSDVLVALQCLDRPPAAVTSMDSRAGMHAERARLHAFKEVRSGTVLFPCRIKRAGGRRHWGPCWRWQLWRWRSKETPLTAVCGMTARFSARLSGLLHREPVLACWALSTKHQIPQHVCFRTCEAKEVSRPHDEK